MPDQASTAAFARPAAMRRVSRDDVVALGRAGKPWEFLPMAAQVLRVEPRDAGLRFLAGANLARLGLGTAAREMLDGLGEAPEISALREALGRLPSDVVPPDEMVRVCRANVVALSGRGIDLQDRFEAWAAGLGERPFLRCLDGNIVRREAGEPVVGLGRWSGLADLVAAARTFVATHFKSGTIDQPCYVEGVDPPWLLREVYLATPTRKDGARQTLIVVQADEMELLDGLAQADLRDVIRDERVRFFVGAGAAERLAVSLRGRMDYWVGGPCIPLTTVRTRIQPGIGEVVRQACLEQQKELARLEAAAAAAYAGKGESWWAGRYRRAMGGEPEAGGAHEPLRVLVPTCRYSTFIQHSSRDLVATLQQAGCDARLMIEPDDESHFSMPAYLRRFAEFRPDLVVLINYTRANMNLAGKAIPAGVPWVCWVQDAMPHLYEPKIGAAQGPLDFLAGHLHRELFTSFGYPMERLLPVPVAADGAKFHPGSVDGALRERHECEVAFVSHHSETPEAMHARLMDEMSGSPAVQRVCERLFPRVRAAVDGAMAACALAAIQNAAVGEIERELGPEADPRVRAMVLRLYGAAMGDRIMRHQTLEWAQAACERNGWRLRVYGRGWEKHPRFGGFARGELAHGEDLRTSYQAAGVHLHASVNTLVHQRVMECALSGGLPLCRLHRDALSGVYAWAQAAACGRGEPTRFDPERGMPGFEIADHPELISTLFQIQRLGVENPSLGFLRRERMEVFRREAARMDSESHAAWLLGDLSEMTFWSEETLERRIRRAVERPAWREAASRVVADRVRTRLTHERLVGRMISMVRDSLERGTPRASATA